MIDIQSTLATPEIPEIIENEENRIGKDSPFASTIFTFFVITLLI